MNQGRSYQSLGPKIKKAGTDSIIASMYLSMHLRENNGKVSILDKEVAQIFSFMLKDCVYVHIHTYVHITDI